MNWRPMLHEKDLSGDVVCKIWESKKIAWHWLALYRRNTKNNKLGIRSTYGSIEFRWNYKAKGYTLLAMEWLGLPRKYRRFRP